MDLSAIIVVISLSVVFFGFVLWMAIYSRKNDSEQLPAEINFSEVGKKNKQYFEK